MIGYPTANLCSQMIFFTRRQQRNANALHRLFFGAFVTPRMPTHNNASVWFLERISPQIFLSCMCGIWKLTEKRKTVLSPKKQSSFVYKNRMDGHKDQCVFRQVHLGRHSRLMATIQRFCSREKSRRSKRIQIPKGSGFHEQSTFISSKRKSGSHFERSLRWYRCSETSWLEQRGTRYYVASGVSDLLSSAFHFSSALATIFIAFSELGTKNLGPGIQKNPFVGLEEMAV